MSKGEPQVLHFEKICRLCLLEKRSMSSIFSKKKSDKKVPLPVRIMSCASLELYEGDGLPSSICSKCLLSVNQSYAFREQCEQADTTLRQYAQRVNEASEEASMNPFFTRLKNESNDIHAAKGTNDTINDNTFATYHPEINVVGPQCLELCTEKHEEGLNKLEHENKKAKETSLSRTCKDDVDLLTRLSMNNEITVKKINFSEKPIQNVFGNESRDVLKDLFEHNVTKDDLHLYCTSDLTKKVPIKIDKDGSIAERKDCNGMQLKRKKGFVTSQFYHEYAAEVEDQDISLNTEKSDVVYCKVCKIFIGRPYFYNHVKYVHKNIRNHLCQDCGYRAQTSHILRQHLESQHSGKVLTCSNCSKSFTCSKRLKFHFNKYHSGKPVERKYICQYCGKAFTTPHYLRSHIRVHTQETPYECHFCKRKFKFKWACKTHERLHTGVKPYKCNYCDESFTQNCARKNHEFRLHGNEEFNPKNRIPKEGNKREKRVL